MKIKILCAFWGHEHLDQKVFMDQVRDAGYDGFDTWVPEDAGLKKQLFDYLQQHEMHIVTHQHQARGDTFEEFKRSFLRNLAICAEPGPLLINSHTGRDYFSREQNLELLDLAQEFSEKNGIVIAHETHRGRIGYSPQMTADLFAANNAYQLTADLSHWVCVTESFLENFQEILSEAIDRSVHIHARVGYQEGPQVPDPRAPEWKHAVDHFVAWWDRIVALNAERKRDILPVTTEFGPKPYMPAIPFTGEPVADLFEVNCYMKDMLNERYARYR
ncbi:sugar phosphate isomerase/epimerase family protein [Compostibacter hankyongensis]|uniref:Xylose isomerase-like TIM barrel domain-containing protein n=1 Tax=Compostibacter hankyongensis TaxID=1007089 RepID=A0ABP8G9I5_9BACT